MKQLKKLFYALLIALLCTFVVPIIYSNISENSYTVQAATKVKLNTTKKTMIKGTTYTLKITGTSKKVTWSSSNKKVAKVSSKGKVTAVGKGTATIKAKVGGKTYSCKVTVEAPSISKTKYTLVKGTSYTLKMNGNTQKVTWSSSNKKVATVNSSGKVTAVAKGTATIKAKIGSKTYSCKVTVETPSLSTTKKTMIKDTTYTLKVSGTTLSKKWSSSNKEVATVSSKGTITAKAKGTATIKVTIGGKTYSCKVTVETPSISTTKYTIIKGNSYTLKMNGNTQKVTWSSSNTKIATVNSSGKVTAIAKGTATITAKIGSKSYSCKITVETPSFEKTSISVNVASNIANPLKNTTKTVTYKTSDSSIARVNPSGTVYGIKAGTSTITATVDGKDFTYTVTVKKVASVSGWKTLYGKKYYYEEGVPATGARTIDNMNYFFNLNGTLLTEYDTTAKFGIDVSGWQYNIDWEKVKESGVEFAIIRCGYGMDDKNQDDSYYKRNIEECERLGIPYGIYLYSYADSVKRADSEADHVLRLAKGHNPALGIWYDIEDSSTSSISNSLHTEIIDTFCEKIKNGGYNKVGVYANLNWLNNKIEPSIKTKYPIWVAQYHSECQYKGDYELWQFTSSGTINGIKGNVDCNIMF